MTAKEILSKVKALFEAPVAPTIPAPAPAVPIVPATLATYKLKDGTEISISGDTVDVGCMVTIGGAPAPSGDYELEDGKKITVDTTGTITLVVAPEPITQPDFVDQPAPSTLEQRAKKLEESIAAIESRISGFESQPNGFDAYMETATKKMEKQEEVIKGLFELVEKLVEMPVADPLTLTGNLKEKFDKANAKGERIKRMAEYVKTQRVLS